MKPGLYRVGRMADWHTAAMNGVFVTGTDTGIGKTWASCALLRGWRAHGLRACGMKPVASGCERTPVGLRNADALALIAASDPQPDYADCNPFAFAPAIAPHVAARLAQCEVDLDTLCVAHARIAARCERIAVEGAGGWLAPFSESLSQAEVARALDLPVVLVVGIKLGAINHALLSARAIQADGCTLAGWIANRIDPAMEHADDTIATIAQRIDAPLIGTLAWQERSPALDFDAH